MTMTMTIRVRRRVKIRIKNENKSKNNNRNKNKNKKRGGLRSSCSWSSNSNTKKRTWHAQRPVACFSQCTCLFLNPPSMSHCRRMIYFSATANLRIVEEQWHRRGRRTRYADFLCHLRLPRDYSINHFAKSLTALRKESYSFNQHHCPSLPASVTVLFPSSLGLSPPLSFTSLFIQNRLSSFIPPFRSSISLG